MNQLLIAIFALSLTATMVACDKSKFDNKESPAPAPAAQEVPLDFSKMAASEVLQAKYDKADLVCQLWNQVGQNLDKTQNPSATLRLNLLEASNLSLQPIVLEDPDDKDVLNQFVIFSMNTSGVEIQAQESFRDESHEYAIQYSPVIKVTRNMYAEIKRPGLPKLVVGGDKESSGPFTIREKITSSLLHEELAIWGENSKRFFEVECSIDTALKPQYQSHFIMK